MYGTGGGRGAQVVEQCYVWRVGITLKTACHCGYVYEVVGVQYNELRYQHLAVAALFCMRSDKVYLATFVKQFQDILPAFGYYDGGRTGLVGIALYGAFVPLLYHHPDAVAYAVVMFLALVALGKENGQFTGDIYFVYNTDKLSDSLKVCLVVLSQHSGIGRAYAFYAMAQ